MENMTKKLSGKVALITGASAGIGQACARALAEEGARLVLTARRQDRLDRLKAEAEKLGTQAISVLGDAREKRTATDTVEAAMDIFGRIDILINNTGAGNYKNLVEPVPRNMTTLWTPTCVPHSYSPGTRFRSCSSKSRAPS